MTENQGRDREISRRDREMRSELIVSEMASAVRVLGGNGPALEQINRAARAARLPHTVIERLRWRKIKRVPADIADAVREAVERYNEETLSRAKHEAFIARQQAAVIAARLSEIDPDSYGPDIDALRRSPAVEGR
jgi:histone H3/H4